MQRTNLGAVCLIAAAYMHAQTLSPREIFYGQGRTDAAPKAAAVSKLKATASKSTPVPDHPADSITASNNSAPQVSLGSSRDEVVSLVSSKASPLGLKYSVMKRGSGGAYSEVDADSNFTAGDRIRVNVEVNDSGYLYVVAQGTSGIWKVLYPSAELNNGDNHVKEGQSYSIPNDAVFTFDSRAGTEKLFVVLSRRPEKDLETLIYSLRDKAPKEGDLSRPLMASNTEPIRDDLVQRLRQTYSRDLVIEKVDDTKTPPSDAVKKMEVEHGALIPPGEKAVYVVNRNANENARVVADVELRHQ